MQVAVLALAVLLNQDAREFVFTADKTYTSVAVAGSFNNWNKLANPMKVGSDGKTWSTRIAIPVGKHGYKFVLDGETWITDPRSKRDENDGNGNVNSILVVFPPDYNQPNKPGDSVITKSALNHAQQVPSLNFDRGKLRFTLRVRTGDVGKVNLVRGAQSVPMTYVPGDEFTSLFKAEVAWDQASSFDYHFLLEPQSAKVVFGPKGKASDAKGNRFKLNAKTFRPFQVPTWVENTIFYQIFPDRFENGNKSNDPKGTQSWAELPKHWDACFGGDLVGVQQRLPYLSQLGVNGVYFNPIFRSPKSHRYETSNYREVDPILGSNADFAKLSRALHTMGIKVVLDGVFNHVAPDFPQFADLVKNQEKSPYKQWFFVKKYPVFVGDPAPYEAWNNFPSMPKVNVDHGPAAEHMLGVIDFWEAEAKIDGWRLDVAGEVSMDFWRKFRKRLKGVDDSRWIVGEVWGDGSPWLRGDQWDSVMNYPFRDAVIQFIAMGSLSSKQFGERLMANYESYAPQVSRNMMNLIGSHDTPRFKTMCGGDDRLAKLGATMLLTWVGAPSIYYGDEIGMEGDKDPDNRRGMEWPKATRGNMVLEHYRELIRIRKSSPALLKGTPSVVLSPESGKAFAFWRTYGQESVLVIVNRSESDQMIQAPLAPTFRIMLGSPVVNRSESGQAKIVVPAMQSAIIRRS